MRMKITTYLFLVFTLVVSAQSSLENSLVFNTTEEKARIHIDNTFESIQNINSAFLHAEQALYYSEKSKNDTLIMESHHALALMYKLKYNYKSSKKHVDIFLVIAKKLDDLYFQMLANNLYGIINATEKKYQISNEYYNKARDLAEEANDTINVSLSYQNLALNYYFINEIELAKMFMYKSLEMYNSKKIFESKEQEDSDYIYLYMKLSLVAETKTEAINFTNLSIERALQTGYFNYASLAYLYKGRAYSRFGDHKNARTNFNKALGYNKKANIKSSEPYLEMMNVLLKVKQYKRAKVYLDTLSRDFSENEIRPLYLDKNIVISEVYKNTGNYDKALYYTEKRAVIADSLLKSHNDDLLIEFGKEFETKEKEKEIINQQLVIEKQSNENKNLLLFGFSTLFAVLLFFQWRFNTQKNKNREVEVAYDKVHEFNQVRTSFLENISHEIRTPLTLINGYLNLIDEETKGNSKVKEHINNALLNSKKVIFDADEILNLLKFEDHRMSLKTVSKPLNDFLKHIFLSFQVIADTRNLELIYKSAISNDYIVEIDTGKIEKIITNLISNAIKFSDSNSKILFEVEIHDKCLEAKVIDFGQGIDKEDQERIFTRFYQSKNNKSLGGIGILLAKGFAEFLGGSLIVESKIGKGSTFTFTMPLAEHVVAEDNYEMISSKKNNSKLNKDKKDSNIIKKDKLKPSILIVEDNIEMSNYLKEILTPFYNCTFAFNGLEGVNLAKEKIFDLVASDVMMPKVDGYEFKKLLKSIPEYISIPFILITAKSLPEDKLEGFSIGIDDYITKPFNKEELIVRMNNLLKNSSELKLSIATQNNSVVDIAETHFEKLLNEIENVILDNLSNENFKVEDLAQKMNYSQRQLSRILNGHTGLSTIKFILEIKLREAYKFIESKKFKTISEVQYEVGITSPSYFSDKFKNRFGIKPSELMQKKN